MKSLLFVFEQKINKTTKKKKKKKIVPSHSIIVSIVNAEMKIFAETKHLENRLEGIKKNIYI